jgi:zinc protease
MIELKDKPAEKIQRINPLNVYHFELDNGLEVNALRTASDGLVKIILSYDNPQRFATEAALAEITFQLLKSGTRNHDLFSFVSLMEETGVMISTSAFMDYGVIDFVVLGDQFETLLPLIAEMISMPAFPEDEFERLKTLALQNWRISRQQTHVLAREQFMRDLYAGHPYGLLPDEESLMNLHLQQAVVFHNDQIANGKPVVYVAASDPERTVEILNQYLGQHLVSQTDSTFQEPHAASVQPSGNPSQKSLQLQGSVQSSIRMGRRLFRRDHTDFVPAKVTSTILGGYFSSRLMANLREDKGYTYGVGAGVIPMVLDSYLTISADVGKEHLTHAVEEIRKEIRRLRIEKIDMEELHTVRQYMSGSILRETDGIFNQLSLLASLNRQGVSANWVETYRQQLLTVTAEDILRIADQYLNPEDLYLVTCGEQSI